MDFNGENARRLYEADGDSALGAPVWSPDGRRILYVRIDATGVSILTRDLLGGIPTTLFAMPPSEDIDDFNWFAMPPSEDIDDFNWLPDGRLIYSMAEPEVIGGRTSCNFWAMRLDSTGKPVEKPSGRALDPDCRSPSAYGKRIRWSPPRADFSFATAGVLLLGRSAVPGRRLV
jgi:Tol biopolymer transport system component